MSSFYLHRDGQNHGPYTDDQLRQMLSQNQVRPDEMICEEGRSDWIPAGALMAQAAPAMGAPVPAPGHHPAMIPVSQQQVAGAYQKLKLPMIGVIFSVALPFLLWAAKSDVERGVGTSGRHQGAKQLVKEMAKSDKDLLPLAIGVGVVGAMLCGFWFLKSLKRAKALKMQFVLQSGQRV